MSFGLQQLGQVHEGWVYFVSAEPTAQNVDGSHQRYITIEIGTKPKPYYHLDDRLHKKIHVLLCCYEHQWSELVKRRKRKYDDTEDVILDDVAMYHSQEHRYPDVQ